MTLKKHEFTPESGTVDTYDVDRYGLRINLSVVVLMSCFVNQFVYLVVLIVYLVVLTSYI